MPKVLQQPSAARAALVEAVEAIRDRARQRSEAEAAYELAVADVHRSYGEISEIEKALKDRPQTAAEYTLERARRYIPQYADLAEPLEEPLSTRDLKARLTLAEEILEDRKRVRDELQARVEQFQYHDFNTDRARDAARAVVRDEAGAVIAQAIADGEAAMVALAKARATLGWLESHGVIGDLAAARAVTLPFSDDQGRMVASARASSPWARIVDELVADPLMLLPATS